MTKKIDRPLPTVAEVVAALKAPGGTVAWVMGELRLHGKRWSAMLVHPEVLAAVVARGGSRSNRLVQKETTRLLVEDTETRRAALSRDLPKLFVQGIRERERGIQGNLRRLRARGIRHP